MDEAYRPFPDIAAWNAVNFNPAAYEEHAALLDAARAEATEEARERAVRTAIRYAGTDTGAIEGLYTTDRGFTRTVAIEAAAWEAAANERGPNAAAIIKDQIAAYEWVLDLATQKVPVTEHLVRELHAMLCRSQETYVVHTELGSQERPLPKGEYKTLPNNPTSLATGAIHYYAPVDAVAPEMHRLVESLTSPEYEAAHPVVQAAYLHYALAAIHPFADGNGRAARALASVPLYRDRRIPLMVLADERDDYLDTLGAADAGDLGSFVSFVHARVLDTIEIVRLTLRATSDADEARSLEALRRLSAAGSERTFGELEALGHRLLAAVAEETDAHVAQLELPPGITITGRQSLQLNAHPGGYRLLSTPPLAWGVTAATTAPYGTPASVEVLCLVATSPLLAPLVLQCEREVVEFRFHDVDPTVRQIARIKIASVVSRAVTLALTRLATNLEDAENPDLS